MNLADRIQNLRKIKGLSQEELADKIGVSRQAVSKWESEQSVPDIDKIILLSEFFQVTSDYLLMGIEKPCPAKTETAAPAAELPNPQLFVAVASMINFIGLIVSGGMWYEEQEPSALVTGLIFMAVGCMMFIVGMISSKTEEVPKAKHLFWRINIWLLTFIPLSFIYNMLINGMAAPYPLLGGLYIAFPIFWLVYATIGSFVIFIILKKDKQKKSL